MESRIVGALNPVDFDPDFFESKPYPIPYFDNKELKICFVAASYKPFLLEADNILQKFLSLNEKNRTSDSEIVYNYYNITLGYGYTKPLGLNSITDIWNFVYPTEIIIDPDEKGVFYLCASCGCEWEREHGLQLVFKGGKDLTRASGNDGHYSDE